MNVWELFCDLLRFVVGQAWVILLRELGSSNKCLISFRGQLSVKISSITVSPFILTRKEQKPQWVHDLLSQVERTHFTGYILFKLVKYRKIAHIVFKINVFLRKYHTKFYSYRVYGWFVELDFHLFGAQPSPP